MINVVKAEVSRGKKRFALGHGLKVDLVAHISARWRERLKSCKGVELAGDNPLKGGFCCFISNLFVSKASSRQNFQFIVMTLAVAVNRPNARNEAESLRFCHQYLTVIALHLHRPVNLNWYVRILLVVATGWMS